MNTRALLPGSAFPRKTDFLLRLLSLLAFLSLAGQALPQSAKVLFEDDFSSNTINPDWYKPAESFFEGDKGGIHAEPGDGVMRFAETTTQWPGSTLRIKESFEATTGSPVALHIDRVKAALQGAGSRSALWVFDETESRYILFADIWRRGWYYNRNIREPRNAPTWPGIRIGAFDGKNDGLLHTMSMVADGWTVKLYLDGELGTEVEFPFSPVIFRFGSYARANGGTADTVWDNLRIEHPKIERSGRAAFTETELVLMAGGPPGEITVALSQGANAENPVTVHLASGDSRIATASGSQDRRLSIVFPAGGPESMKVPIDGLSAGSTQLSLSSSDLLVAAGTVRVTVMERFGGFGEVLSFNTGDWRRSSENLRDWEDRNREFRSNSSPIWERGFPHNPMPKTLRIGHGSLSTNYWSGDWAWTQDSFLATPDINLVAKVDRVSVEANSASRSGIFLSNSDRSRYLFFSQQYKDGINSEAATWHVNVNPGSPSGTGTVIPAFSGMDCNGTYRLGLVADGSMVEVSLDGVPGGRFPFPVSSGIRFGIGTYGQSETERSGDYVLARFANASVSYALPCIRLESPSPSITLGQSGEMTVSVPLLAADREVRVALASSDPSVAVPAGASGSSLDLVFPAGSPRSRTVAIEPRGIGSAVFSLSGGLDGTCLGPPADLRVHPRPEVLLSDGFDGTQLDAGLWQIESASFNQSGRAKPGPDSSVSLADGRLRIHVEVEAPLWPGLAAFTRETFSASDSEPLTFSVERSLVDFVLAAGASSESRTGIWARSGDQYIFFSDHTTHDGRDFGWRYNRSGGADENEISGDGINIRAFDGEPFDDRGSHLVSMVLDGATARLYLDGVPGPWLPFPHAEDLAFGIGAYADDIGPSDAEGDIVGNQTIGLFDNALVTGGRAAAEPAGIAAVSLSRGSLAIEWSGRALEQADAVTGPWTPIAGAVPPSFSLPAGAGARFVRAVP